MGKIVTAYNEGQCEINAGHSWNAGDEIFWQKNENGQVIKCNVKACFDAQGGEAQGEIKTSQEPPKGPTTIDKHTGLHTKQEKEIQQNDVELHGAKAIPKECKKCGFKITIIDDKTQKNWEAHVEGHERPQAREMDVVDIAGQKMKEEYVTYAKEIKIIEEALNAVFPGSMEGQERGMKTKLMWDMKHHHEV